MANANYSLSEPALKRQIAVTPQGSKLEPKLEIVKPPRYTLSWTNAIVITLSPILALTLGILYVRTAGFAWADFANYLFMYTLAGLSITAGYHRYFSHRSYECNAFVKFIWLIFGASAVQNSALAWSSDHRIHHRYSDKDQDPYNISKGFFWAHMGWIYFIDREKPELENVRDLQKDRLVMWQHRNYILILLVVGFGLPFLIGLACGRPWGGLLWGGLIRMVLGHHTTFLINSAAHTFGTKPASSSISARDCWWLSFFSFGEGYHNYHHAHPSDYRNGVAWYHCDITKWVISALSVPGWTWNLRRISKTES